MPGNAGSKVIEPPFALRGELDLYDRANSVDWDFFIIDQSHVSQNGSIVLKGLNPGLDFRLFHIQQLSQLR